MLLIIAPFLISVGASLKHGAGITKQIYFDKACLYALGHPPDVCAALADHPEASAEVQRTVNQFQMSKDIFMNCLVVVGSMFAGSMADRFGMKACMLTALSCKYGTLNYIKRALPLLV